MALTRTIRWLLMALFVLGLGVACGGSSNDPERTDCENWCRNIEECDAGDEDDCLDSCDDDPADATMACLDASAALDACLARRNCDSLLFDRGFTACAVELDAFNAECD